VNSCAIDFDKTLKILIELFKIIGYILLCYVIYLFFKIDKTLHVAVIMGIFIWFYQFLISLAYFSNKREIDDE
jgi:hypothetical protein